MNDEWNGKPNASTTMWPRCEREKKFIRLFKTCAVIRHSPSHSNSHQSVLCEPMGIRGVVQGAASATHDLPSWARLTNGSATDLTPIHCGCVGPVPYESQIRARPEPDQGPMSAIWEPDQDQPSATERPQSENSQLKDCPNHLLWKQRIRQSDKMRCQTVQLTLLD